MAMDEEIIFGNLYDTQNKTESVVIVLKVLLIEWGYLPQAKIVYRSVSHQVIIITSLQGLGEEDRYIT